MISREAPLVGRMTLVRSTTFTLAALILAMTAPNAAAEQCFGDTTGPFTPEVCLDEENSTVSATAGVAAVTANTTSGSESASATVRTRAGDVTATVARS